MQEYMPLCLSPDLDQDKHRSVSTMGFLNENDSLAYFAIFR